MSSIKTKKKKNRKTYTKETLKEAMAAINAGVTVNAASKMYNIPPTTLHNKKRTKDLDSKPGPEKLLNDSQEMVIAQWVFDCSNIGMPIGRKHIQNSIPLFLKSLNKNRSVGRKWYTNFLKRNERVVERVLKNNSIAKAAATEGGVKNWFANVEVYLQEKGLWNVHPSRIFSSETVVLKNPERNKSAEDFYVQVTGSADGKLTCPMIAFTPKNVSDNVCKTMPAGWTIGKSEDGSITAENFYEYVKDNFYPWLVANNVELPVVLFLDGRVAHMTMALTEFCKEHKIELIALHPNSSHVLHPLQTLITSLNVTWKQIVKKKKTKIAKENLAPCLKSTLESLNVAELLTSGFEKCGLYPFLVDSVDFKKIPDRLSLGKVQKEKHGFGPFVSTETQKPTEESDKEQEIQEECVPSTAIETHKPTEQMRELTDAEFLQLFEQKMDPNTLQTFKIAQQCEIWTGRVEDTALFYFWKDAVNRAQTNFTENLMDYSGIEFDNVDKCDNQSEDANITEHPLKICKIVMNDQ